MTILLFAEFFGIILALGTIMILFVMTNMARKSQELSEIIIKFGDALKWFRPMMWFGIAITGIVWTYVMFTTPLTTLSLVCSLVLVIAIILSALISSKISKMEYEKNPIISATLLVLIWWIFVYLSINVIILS